MRTIRRPASLAALLALVVAPACLSADEPAARSDEVAARIGDQAITLDEVDREAKKLSIQPYQALYDARSKALEQLIDNRLLEQEANRRGVSVDELIALEVNAKVTTVSDAEVETFFNQNQNRMGGRGLEEMKGPIRDYLQSGAGDRARRDYLQKLRASAAVRISLEPPRAEVVIAANDPAKGPAQAPVTIVEYSDFQ